MDDPVALVAARAENKQGKRKYCANLEGSFPDRLH